MPQAMPGLSHKALALAALQGSVLAAGEASSCFLQGAAYGDVTLAPNGGYRANALACQAECKVTTWCFFFSFKQALPGSELGMCWKHPKLSVKTDAESTIVAGPRECPTLIPTIHPAGAFVKPETSPPAPSTTAARQTVAATTEAATTVAATTAATLTLALPTIALPTLPWAAAPTSAPSSSTAAPSEASDGGLRGEFLWFKDPVHLAMVFVPVALILLLVLLGVCCFRRGDEVRQPLKVARKKSMEYQDPEKARDKRSMVAIVQNEGTGDTQAQTARSQESQPLLNMPGLTPPMLPHLKLPPINDLGPEPVVGPLEIPLQPLRVPSVQGPRRGFSGDSLDHQGTASFATSRSWSVRVAPGGNQQPMRYS